MTDICEISTPSKLADPLESEARAATPNHLTFAVGTRHIISDNESHSQRSGNLQSEDRQQHDWEKIICVAEKSHLSERRSVNVKNDIV